MVVVSHLVIGWGLVMQIAFQGTFDLYLRVSIYLIRRGDNATCRRFVRQMCVVRLMDSRYQYDVCGALSTMNHG